jgi:tetratricopeptide (TPR) repeat protein
MRKPALIFGVVAATVAFVLIVIWYVQPRPAARSGKSQATASDSTGLPAIVQTARLPPEPDVSLDINNKTELEVHQGTPLLLTIRLANQRAANALSTNAAREAIAADAREQLKAGAITAAESQAREAFSRQREGVPTLVLPPDWPKSIHVQVRRANDPASQPDWPVSLLVAPAKQALALDGTATTEATWGLSPEAAALLAPGSWQLVAILDTIADAPADAWRGHAVSQPVIVTIKPRPASLPVAEAEQDALEVSRYYAAAGQWDNSLAAARKAAALIPDSIEAHTLIGDALSAGGDKRGAMKAYQTAMAAFQKQNKDPRHVADYLIERMHELLLTAPPPGLAPEGTKAPPPPMKR